MAALRGWMFWRNDLVAEGLKPDKANETWGLIYKTVCRIHVKRLRTDKTQKVLMHKNILIYNSVHACPTPVSLYESQSTRNVAHLL